MVKSKKGHNFANISRNSLKSYSGHLNIDPKPYAKYENPCTSGPKEFLSRFFMAESKKGLNFAIQGLTKTKKKKKKKKKNKRAMMALGRSPEYHWNQIISKSVHWLSRRSRLKLFFYL